MIADLVIIITVILLSIFLIVRYINKRKKNKISPYSSACGSCSMANKCLKLKKQEKSNND